MMARAIFFNSIFNSARWGVAFGIVIYYIEKIVLDLIIDEPFKVSAIGHIFAGIAPSYHMEKATSVIVALEIM